MIRKLVTHTTRNWFISTMMSFNPLIVVLGKLANKEDSDDMLHFNFIMVVTICRDKTNGQGQNFVII